MSAWKVPTNMPATPKGFKAPTINDYGAKLAQATKGMVADSGWMGSAGGLTPPLIQQVAGIKSTLEAAANEQLGGLLSANSAGMGKAMHAAITLARGDVAATVKAVFDAIGSFTTALDSVPMVGQMVGFLVNRIAMLATMGAEARKAELEACKLLHDELRVGCKARVQHFMPFPATGGQPSPADLFRHVLFAYQGGMRLPLDLGSIYVLMCGGETQGFGFSRDQYNSWLNAARKSSLMVNTKKSDQNHSMFLTHPSQIGIPKHVQRQLWAYIKATMYSVGPTMLGKIVVSDEGELSFPVVNDILYEQYLQGRWNWNTVSSMSNWLAGHGNSFAGSGRSYAFAAAVPTDRFGNCGSIDSRCRKDYGIFGHATPWGGYVNFADAFRDSVRAYVQGLYENFCEVPLDGEIIYEQITVNGHKTTGRALFPWKKQLTQSVNWTGTGTEVFQNSLSGNNKGVLSISPQLVMSVLPLLQIAGRKAEEEAARAATVVVHPKRSLVTAAAGVAGVAGAGALAFLGARRAANFYKARR